MIARCAVALFLGEEFASNREMAEIFCSFHESVLDVVKMGSMLPRWTLGLFAGRVRKQTRVLYRLLLPEVERRLQLIKDNPNVKDPVGTLLSKDLVSILCATTSHTAQQIADRMFTFIFASMITTAGVASNALNEFASRTESVQWIMEELESNQVKHGTQGITMDLLDD